MSAGQDASRAGVAVAFFTVGAVFTLVSVLPGTAGLAVMLAGLVAAPMLGILTVRRYR